MPPAPARVPVLLWAIVAFVFAGPGYLWRPWERAVLVDQLQTSVSALALANAISSAPILLGLLWAYLSDRVAILGTRREGHLVVAGLLAAVAWAAAPFVPRSYGTWVGIELALTTGVLVSRASVQGGLAEIGVRRRTTGRLSAAQLGLYSLASLAATTAIDFLVQHSLGWTASAGAAMAMSMVLLTLLLPRDGTAPASDLAPANLPIPRWLRSATFWSVLLVMACAAFPKALYDILQQHLIRTLQVGDEVRALASRASSLMAIAATDVYFFGCKRLPLRWLLPYSMTLEAATLLSLLALGQAGEVMLALAATGFGGTFASCARVDLVFRTVPARREAFGAILLTASTPLFAVPISAFGYMSIGATGSAFNALVLALAAATALSALTVFVVPRVHTAGRDGTPPPSA
jgi:hypothetical protein